MIHVSPTLAAKKYPPPTSFLSLTVPFACSPVFWEILTWILSWLIPVFVIIADRMAEKSSGDGFGVSDGSIRFDAAGIAEGAAGEVGVGEDAGRKEKRLPR